MSHFFSTQEATGMSSPRPTPRYYTPAEVAAELRISPITAIRLCRAGKLPAVKVGGAWRIPADALAAHLEIKKAS